MKNIKFYIFFFVLSLFLFKYPVSATENSISISPPFIDLSIDNDKQIKEFEISLINNSEYDIYTKISSVDFTVNDNYSGVIFQGLSDKDFSNKFSLASWLEVPQETILVSSKTTKKVKISLKNSNLLPPGGRYGAVLFTLESNSNSKELLSINQTYSSLIFLKKAGAKLPKLNLEKYSYKNKIFSINNEFKLNLKNYGDYHVIPRGTIKIYDNFGNNIYKGIINSDSQYLLPNTSRDYIVNLNKIKKHHFFGIYKFEISYRYDGINDFTKVKKAFIYINPLFIFLPLIIPFFFIKKLKKN